MASGMRGVTDNWKLKTLAFALAVLLWVVVSAEQVTTNWIWVPLEVRVTDPNYRIASNEVPPEVQVRFTGPGRELLDLALDRPPLRLEVAEVEDLVETVPLDPRMVQLPGQVAASALDVRPAAVRLEFTRMESQNVPVRVRVEDRLGGEWAVVDSIRSDPASILVSGSTQQMIGLTALRTEAIQLTPEDTIIDRTVAIDTTGLAGLELATQTVHVVGRLDRVIEHRLTGVEVDVGPGVTILPGRVAVDLTGPRQAIEELSPEDFRVVIAINEIPERLPAGGVSIPLRVDGLRPDIAATVDPTTVRLFPGSPEVDTPEGRGPAALADTLSVVESGGR